MSWKSKFIVFRPSAESSALTQAFHSNDFKQTNYWLRYIALNDDALFITEHHPKHPGGDAPVYHSHKVGSGSTEKNEAGWREKYGSLTLPTEELAEDVG